MMIVVDRWGLNEKPHITITILHRPVASLTCCERGEDIQPLRTRRAQRKDEPDPQMGIDFRRLDIWLCPLFPLRLGALSEDAACSVKRA